MEKGDRMRSEKLSYAGIAGAVAGIIGLLSIFTDWYSAALPGVVVSVKATAFSSGKLALGMSIALFAFSAAYVVMDDARIRRSMAALMIVTAVVLTFSFIWGVTSADGLTVEWGLWMTGLAGVLGIAAGILTLKEAPLGVDTDDEPEAAEAATEAPATEAPAEASVEAPAATDAPAGSVS
jgi:hypothetical protein